MRRERRSTFAGTSFFSTRSSLMDMAFPIYSRICTNLLTTWTERQAVWVGRSRNKVTNRKLAEQKIKEEHRRRPRKSSHTDSGIFLNWPKFMSAHWHICALLLAQQKQGERSFEHREVVPSTSEYRVILNTFTVKTMLKLIIVGIFYKLWYFTQNWKALSCSKSV